MTKTDDARDEHELRPLNEKKRDVLHDEQSNTSENTKNVIWFILSSWFTPRVDFAYKKSKLFNRFARNEIAKNNYERWKHIESSNIIVKLGRFLVYPLFWATLFQFVSILSGFLTLVSMFPS